MKKFSVYTFLLAIASIQFSGCTINEIDIKSEPGIVTVMGSAAEFKGITVDTKAVEEDEKKVTEITMAIFDSDGNVVGKMINISDSNPVFVIDTKHTDIEGNPKPYILAGGETIYITNAQNKLESCDIYMLANCWKHIKNSTIENKSHLHKIDIAVDGINIPDEGFPMIGKSTGINLSAGRQGGTQMEDITMLKLYAKINVSLQINAENVIANPKFTLTGWSVKNVPSYIRLQEPEGNAETDPSDKSIFSTAPSTQLSSGNLNIAHSVSLDNPDKMQFTFYIPEYRVNPDISITYPSGITESEKQRFKPLLCSDSKKPAYVTIEGIYTDHQEMMHEVTYNLYLGQNNVNDFHINRNQQLNNIVTIKGVTNNHPGTNDVVNNISADYRVIVESEGNYIVKVEREALLDSHYEVRPMDIYISGKGSVRATVIDNSSTDATNKNRIWLRMEKSSVRDYFTTNLVTETLEANSRVDITSESDDTHHERIWLYFDENPNVFDRTLPTDETKNKQYRDITIKLQYFNERGQEVKEQERNITFRQMNLWRLWSYTDETKTTKKRFYDIEYHEEYLNNYASNQQYGQTTDGMPWGLNGTSLSKYYEASSLGSSGSDIWDAILGFFGATLSPYYDYSLDDDKNEIEIIDKFKNIDIATTHQYAGLHFTQQIAFVSNINSNITELKLNKTAENAIQYCLNKNKRNSNGQIPINGNNAPEFTSDYVKWYLPSIDEIQEIVVSGYQDFEVFHDKYYWSSQPAYEIASVYQKTITGNNNLKGYMLQENSAYSRATNAIYKNESWSFEKSGIKDETYRHQLTWLSSYDKNSSGAVPIDNGLIDKGYMPRNTINRIRCVRNSGTTASIGQ